jgi:hypothetical protein
MRETHDAPAPAAGGAAQPARGQGPENVDLKRRPEMVLAVLEPDQLVDAKERCRFGQRRLSKGIRALLWGLRLYVVAMMLLVAIQVLHAVRGAH